MNLDELLKKFRQFENDDQRFWEEVIGGQEPDPPPEVLAGRTRMKLHEAMVVQHEIVENMFEEDFVTPEDSDIRLDLENKLEALGLDPRLARQVIEKSRSERGPVMTPAAQPFSKIPARQWKQARKRLDEEAKRTARILLNRVSLNPEGVELPRKLSTEIGARTNFIAALTMVKHGHQEDGRRRP